MQVYIDSWHYRLATFYGALTQGLRYPVKLYVLNVLFGGLIAFVAIPGAIGLDVWAFYRVFGCWEYLSGKQYFTDQLALFAVWLQLIALIVIGSILGVEALKGWFKRANGKLIEPIGRVTWKDEEASE